MKQSVKLPREAAFCYRNINVDIKKLSKFQYILPALILVALSVGVNIAYSELAHLPMLHSWIALICLGVTTLIFVACIWVVYKANHVKLKLKARDIAAIELRENNLQLAREISHRLEVQKELQYSERRLKTILNTVKTGIVIIDCQTHEILEVNSSAAAIIGDKKENIVGKSCHGFICPYTNGDCPISDHGQVIHESEQVLLTVNEQKVPILKTITMVKLNGRNCLLESLVDISEQKAIHEQLKEARELAETSAATKSQFLANMSHEIRTPMNAIIGFGGLLIDENLTVDQKDYVNLICTASEELLVIIDDILDFSKIEAGKMDIEMVTCNIPVLMKDMKSLMLNLASEKELEYEILTSEEVPQAILTDATRIRQCLINLINNAIKFTKAGHVHVDVHMHGRGAEAFVCFDVEDTGIGIDQKRQAAIFDSFTQGDGSTCREFGGTGLGLTITKQLAKLLGGGLSVLSKLGEGSTFTLKIPARTPLELEGDKTNTQDLENSIQRAALKALVAEDSITDQTLIKILLEKQGFEVTVVDDGSDAVAIISEEVFDVIFMDIHMPGINGYEATENIRAKGIETPVIAITADLYTSDAEKCIASGCDGYITKPVDRAKLYEVVTEHLASKLTS